MVGRLVPRLPAMLLMLQPACQWANTSSASRTVTLLLAIRSCPASFNVCWTKHATSSFRCAPGWVNYLKNEVGQLLENKWVISLKTGWVIYLKIHPSGWVISVKIHTRRRKAKDIRVDGQ